MVGAAPSLGGGLRVAGGGGGVQDVAMDRVDPILVIDASGGCNDCILIGTTLVCGNERGVDRWCGDGVGFDDRESAGGKPCQYIRRVKKHNYAIFFCSLRHLGG